LYFPNQSFSQLMHSGVTNLISIVWVITSLMISLKSLQRFWN